MTATMPGGDGRYVTVESPYEVARWRPLVNWILVIPHLIITSALQFLARAVFFVHWFVVLFTGRPNPGLYGVLALYERYNVRMAGFLFGFTETYPPFDFNQGPHDNGAFAPIRMNVPEPPESISRRHLANFLLAIPHYIVLFVFGIGAAVVLVIGWFAVIFTGAWPTGMRDFLVRLQNYWLRVWTYVTMVQNDYPRFGLPR